MHCSCLNRSGRVRVFAALGLGGMCAAPGAIEQGAVAGIIPIASSSSLFTSYPDAPVMNELGQVAFRQISTIVIIGNPPTQSIRRGDGESIVTIASTGGAPATGAGTFLSFSTSEGVFTDLGTKISDTGSVMFHAIMQGTGVNNSNDTGIFSGSGGSAGQVAREGQTVSIGGTNMEYIGFHAMSINNVGEQAYRAAVDVSGIVGTKIGVFRRQSGTPVLVARQDDAAPGGGNFLSLAFNSVVGGATYQVDINNNSQGSANQVAFYSSLDNATLTTDSGLYRASSQTSEFLHAREGQSIGGSSIAFLSHPDLNNLNQIAYFTQLANGNQGVYRSSISGGGLATLLVAQEGDSDAEGDVFTSFGFEPVLSNTGWVAFRANLDNSNDEGLYRKSTGASLTPIAKRGDAPDVPGPDNNFFSDLTDSFSINDKNHVAFLAEVSQGFVTYEGIYVGAGGGKQPIEVARVGHQINGKTITDLKVNLGRDTGGNIGFNDKAQVAFYATFSDNSKGIFRWTPTLKITTQTNDASYNWNSTGDWNLFMLPDATYDVAIADDPTKLPVGGATVNGPTGPTTVANLYLGEERGFNWGANVPDVALSLLHPSGSSPLATPKLTVDGTMDITRNGVLFATDQTMFGNSVPVLDVKGELVNDGEVVVTNARVRAGGFENRGLMRGHGIFDGRLNNDSGAEVSVGMGQTLLLENTADPGDAGENHGLIQLMTEGTLGVSGRLVNDSDGQIMVGQFAEASFDEMVNYGNVSGLLAALVVSFGDWTGHGVSIPDGGTVLIGGILRPRENIIEEIHSADFDSDLEIQSTGGLAIDFAPDGGSLLHDRVLVSGEARLAGVLSVDVWEHAFSSMIDSGDEFEIMTYGSREGKFEEYVGLFPADGELILVPRYTAGAMSLLATVLGDMNGNGFLDSFDVDEFELALADKDAYLELVGLDPDIVGDMDGNGVLNAFDVSVFEAVLAAAATPVPEPASLAILGLGGLAGRRRRTRGGTEAESYKRI